MMRLESALMMALLAVCSASPSSHLSSAGPAQPSVELRSEAITPGLALPESQKPIHQVRVLADVGRPGVSRGTLVLDPNQPVFDEFGALEGGLTTPQSKGQRGALPELSLECQIESVKTGRGEQAWHLYRLTGPRLKSPLRLATLGPITSSGPARLLVLGEGDRVESVFPLTRYGLVAP
jgi:hypothetical protein